MGKNTQLTAQEMVVEVDNYVGEMGINREMLGFENDEDKILYFYNYIDENNVFKGILELHNHYFIKLLNLLCNTTERIKMFQEKYYDADGSIAQQIRQFRRYLLDSRNNTNEYLGVIDKMIKGQLWSELHSCLEELFLENIEKHIFDRIQFMIHNEGLNASDIYNFYIQKRNVKSLVTFKTEYIKKLNKI